MSQQTRKHVMTVDVEDYDHVPFRRRDRCSTRPLTGRFDLLGISLATLFMAAFPRSAQCDDPKALDDSSGRGTALSRIWNCPRRLPSGSETLVWDEPEQKETGRGKPWFCRRQRARIFSE